MRFKLEKYVISIPSPFQSKFATDPERKFRRGKFTPRLFLETMVNLVTGTNLNGAAIALMHVFAISRKQMTPWASSFSRLRKRIHWSWFQEVFESLLKHCDRQLVTYGGLRVIAVDGQQLCLRRSADIVKHGYNGRVTGDYRETFLPRAFLVAASDVINGICLGFTFNPTLNEPKDARNLLKRLPSKALFIYDRLYFSKNMISAHIDHDSRFPFRCRRNAKREILEFFQIKKLKSSFEYGGTRIHLIRVKNAKTGKYSIFATDLAEDLRSPTKIDALYRSRWEIENSFRDSTATLRTEEWHSKTFNGNMQEIYTAYWFLNLAKLASNEACQKVFDPEEMTYTKVNFKLTMQYLREKFNEIWVKFYRIVAHLESLSKNTTAKRVHCKRSYKRELKRPRSPYPHIKTGWNWERLHHEIPTLPRPSRA